MPLIKPTYEQALTAGFKVALTKIMTAMQESDTPANVISQVSEELAKVVADQTDAYIKSATVTSVHVPILASPSGPVTGTITTSNTIS